MPIWCLSAFLLENAILEAHKISQEILLIILYLQNFF